MKGKPQCIQKVSAEYKRARKYKIQAKMCKQVFLNRTEVDMRTYRSETTIQDSDKKTITSKRIKNNNKKRFCNWCVKENTHTIWRSKNA